MDTLETKEYPQNAEMSFGDDEDGQEDGEDDGEKKETPKYLQWKNVLSFEPLDSSESFRIMENFPR